MNLKANNVIHKTVSVIFQIVIIFLVLGLYSNTYIGISVVGFILLVIVGLDYLLFIRHILFPNDVKFEVVSKMNYQAELSRHYKDVFTDSRDIIPHSQLEAPRRATRGSAGYDFKATFPFTLNPSESIIIPTGIRAKLREDLVLMLYPRSGLGFKYQCGLANTVGVVDSDYYSSRNEGHIMIKLVNNGNKPLLVETGDSIAQGVVNKYYVNNSNVNNIRDGGFGSTDSK